MKVLHLVPASYLDGSQLYLGSTKDIASRVQYFEDRGIPFRILALEKNPEAAIRALEKIPVETFTHILVEKHSYWRLLRYLKQRAPAAKLWLRGHNAEFPHRVGHFLSALPAPVTENRKRLLGNIWRFSLRDIAASVHADRVLGICQWETEHYWPKLGAGSRTTNVPFFLPRKYLEGIPNDGEKQDICLCLTSTDPGPITHDAVRGFLRALRSLGGVSHGWKFVVAGQIHPEVRTLVNKTDPRPAVEWYPNPYEALVPARAICILSDHGYGFKTKILESILCRTYVLVTPGLWKRLPEELKRYCFQVSPWSPASFLTALERCREPFPEGTPNEALQKAAYGSLDHLFQA